MEKPTNDIFIDYESGTLNPLPFPAIDADKFREIANRLFGNFSLNVFSPNMHIPMDSLSFPYSDPFERDSLAGRRSPRKLRKLRRLKEKHRIADQIAKRMLG